MYRMTTCFVLPVTICRRVIMPLLCCLLLPGRIPAQELLLKHISVDQGLPSNEIYQILEDKSGYLWAATDRGIVRYDGYSFQEMRLKEGTIINPAFGIYEAPSGRIYFSGLKGRIAIYDNGQLSAYPHNDRISAQYPQSGYLVIDALSERGDSLWINYNNSLGNCLVLPDGSITQQTDPEGIHFDLSRDFYFYILDEDRLLGKKHPVFITWKDGTRYTDSIRFDRDTRYIRKLYFVGAGGYELFCIGRRILIFKDRKKQGEVLLHKNVLSITSLDEGRIAVGFERGGAIIYHLEASGLRLERVYKKDLSVTCIHQDIQKGLWFSTMESGLYYAHPARAFRRPGPGRIAFIEQNNGTAFIGFQSGQIHLYRSGNYESQINIPVTDGEMLVSFAFQADGGVVGTTTKGFYIPEGKRWRFHPAEERLLLPVAPGRIYTAAIAYPLLHEYDLSSTGPPRTIELPKRIISIAGDSSGRIWLGTIEGLYVYENGRLHDMGRQHKIFYDRIVSVRKLPQGLLAVATLNNGLILHAGSKLHILNTGNGLITPIINRMWSDKDTIWLGTNKGISRVVYKNDSFRIRHFSEGFGLPTLDVHEMAVVNGWLYFKWIDDLVTIELARLYNPLTSDGVRILSVEVNNKDRDIHSKGYFAYNQNEVKIGYNSINFAHGPQQRYRYKLKGFDQEWQTSGERQAAFNNLPPGSYSFVVQVSDALGNFLEPAAQYNFEISPAFWQQWWFPAIIGLLMLGLAWLIFKRRVHKIKKNNQLQLDLAESQQKALVQLVSPHFIFNILNTAQAAVLEEDKIDAASIISRFARLMRLSLELSRQKKVTLGQETELLKKYLELEMIRFPRKFTYDIVVDPDIDVSLVSLPSMLIQPFIENSIKHGIMHLKGRDGYIRLMFTRSGNVLFCTVDDNGIGRQQSAIINANRLRHNSFGITITQERLQLLHREHKTDYYYKVEDKYNTEGDPYGTVIVFSIPIKYGYEANQGNNH